MDRSAGVFVDVTTIEDPRLGALIVGERACTGSTTRMRFRFSAGGRYASRESLEYPVPSGRFVFHRDQEGSYVTGGDRLELRPARSARTRQAPADPGGDYADRPEAPKPRIFTFRAESQTLHLHESGGHPLVLTRTP